MKKLTFILLTLTLNIANAQTWHSVGNINGYVHTLKVIENDLFIIGLYSHINGIKVNGISKFDEIKFDSLGGGFFNVYGSNFSIEKFNNDYYLGGGFVGLNYDYNIKYIAKWNGVTWTGFNHYPNSEIKYLKFKNKLYVGGRFQTIGTTNYKYIASFNDTTWSSVGDGLTGGGSASTGIYCMTEYMGDLIVGGVFSKMGNTLANNIARWDGTNWHALGNGVDGMVSSFCVDSVNNILYVGGGIFTADTISVRYVAGWNGTNWFAPGQGITGGALAMTMFKNELYIGGQYYIPPDTTNNDSLFYPAKQLYDTLHSLARWDGNEWIPVYGPNGTVNALAVYNGNLFVGGNFSSINDDTSLKYLACYGDSCPNIVSVNNQVQIKNYELQIFPNPSNEMFTIETSIPEGIVGSLRVYSLKGELIKEIALDNEQSSTILDVSKWQKGNYICCLYLDGRLLKSESMLVH